MRSLWLIISTVAVANILALAGFVAWLYATHRLDRDRLERVRLIFATTIDQERAAAEQAKIQLASDQAVREEQERMTRPPEPADARIQRQDEADLVQFQQTLRRQRELEDLRRVLARERQQLSEDAAALAREKAEFDAYRKRLAEIEGAAQFKKALATLEAQKPKDAKEVLQALLNQSEASGGGTEQVVSYLSAMDERIRGKIIAEFIKDRPELAADLLERLRTRGLQVGVAAAPAP